MGECFEAALEEARKVDQLIKSGIKDAATLELELPFLGVPFTTKESVSIKGILNYLFYCILSFFF